MLKNLYIQNFYCIFALELINSNNLTNFIKAMAYGNQNRRHYDNRRGAANYRRPNFKRNDAPENGDENKPVVRYPGLPRYVQNIEPHIVRMIRVLHANADIRRYTALGIVKRLIAAGKITEEGNYVRFRWDKYTVSSKGINTDYRYTEKVFLESFVGSFGILTSVASKSLDNFCKIEFDNLADKVLDDKEIDKTSEEIINHQVDADENIAQFEEEKQ